MCLAWLANNLMEYITMWVEVLKKQNSFIVFYTGMYKTQ